MNDPIKETVSTMPDVNEAAVATEAAKAESARSPVAGEPLDTQGNVFDPAIHEANGYGSPRLSARGKLLRKRGRVTGKEYADSKPKGQSTVGKAPEPGALNAPNLAGKAAADAVILAGIVIGGEEFVPAGWQPSVGQNESEMLAMAFSEFFKAKGVEEVSPAIGLGVALTAYIGPRLFLPKTKTRLARVKDWFKYQYIKLRYGDVAANAAFNEEIYANAPTNSRSNSERKDDTSQKAG